MEESTRRRARIQSVISDLRTVGERGPRPFTDDEYTELFGPRDEGDETRPRRRTPTWLWAMVIVGMLGTSAFIAWRSVADGLQDVRNPGEVLQLAQEYAAESPWEWLITDIEVLPINNIDIGGFVKSSPPDGVIAIDRRPWNKRELEEVVHHEIGHLLDFAAWDPGVPVRRGGLESEVWAECAAVHAGVRDLDGDGATQEYRCAENDLSVYRTALSLLDEVCRRWGDPECRPVPQGVP